jgi:hypothetical protein
MLKNIFLTSLTLFLLSSMDVMGQRHYAFEKMTEEELIEIMVYCQGIPVVKHLIFLNEAMKLGIYGRNEAVVLNKNNLIADSIDIGYNPMRHFVGNAFWQFFHTSKTSGFGLNTNMMTFFSWNKDELVIEKFISVHTSLFSSKPKGKHQRDFIVWQDYQFGYTMDQKENGLKPSKTPPVFYFASKDQYWVINPNPIVANKQVFNSEIGMSTWFEGAIFPVGDHVLVNAEMENRLYVVNTATRKVDYYSLPEPPNKGVWRVFYDFFEEKFYLVNKSKLGYEISLASNDFSSISSPLIITDQEPVRIINGKVQITYKSKRKDTPCHFLIPLQEEDLEF